MKRYLLLILLLTAIVQVHSQVVINEFQPANESTVSDPDFDEYEDWIELYNSGSSAVDLGGYFLSDKFTDTTMWKIPEGTTIEAGEYLMLWADNKDYKLHTNFKLSAKGEQIALFSDELVLVDRIQYNELEDDESIGRKGDGGTVWRSFTTPTPDAANGSGTTMQAPEVVFSAKGGYYESSLTLSLESLIPSREIYYTTDGSTPTSSSKLYSSPINITANTVVKVIVVHSSYYDSRVSSRTYFIDERESSLPVVSLGVDPYDFFDETYGIYSLGPDASSAEPYYGANFWWDEELPVTFEYFVDGKQKVQTNAGIQIHGGWSRRFDQRSFSINCRQAYGDERMRYQFFEDKNIDVFKQIVLKNGGVDVMSLKYRDMMIQNLVKDRMDIDYQEGRPCIVYINGEYWGILNLREKIQERYLKDNYDLDDDEIDLLANYSEVIEGSDEEFYDFFLYWGDYWDYGSYSDDYPFQDMTSSSIYSSVASDMNISEFINYMITEIYVSNHDWPGCNIKYWKQKGDEYKWRWILYDTDQSFAYYDEADETTDRLSFATSPTYIDWGNSNPNSTVMLRSLLENTTFKNTFIQRFAAHLNSTFEPSRVVGIIDEFEDMVSDEKAYHRERWVGTEDSTWEEEYDAMITFADARPDYVRTHIKDYFDLSGTAYLVITNNLETAASYQICGVDFSDTVVSGSYFKNVPFNVKAFSTVGQKFLHWEDLEGNIISSDETISITLTADRPIVAIFEEEDYLENIYINEFMADNKSTYFDNKNDYDDWIELYNDNSYSVDIAGLYITDSLGNPLQYMIPESEDNETVISAKGFIVLWADEEESQGVLHLPFKLDKDGEQIGLVNFEDSTVKWVDSLSFGSQTSDISEGRTTDAASTFTTFIEPTPGKSNTEISSVETVDSAAVQLYPTIVDDYITVAFEIPQSTTISVYSLLGRIVGEFSTSSEDSQELYFGDIAKGLYIVHIQGDNISKDFKVIKR